MRESIKDQQKQNTSSNASITNHFRHVLADNLYGDKNKEFSDWYNGVQEVMNSSNSLNSLNNLVSTADTLSIPKEYLECIIQSNNNKDNTRECIYKTFLNNTPMLSAIEIEKSRKWARNITDKKIDIIAGSNDQDLNQILAQIHNRLLSSSNISTAYLYNSMDHYKFFIKENKDVWFTNNDQIAELKISTNSNYNADNLATWMMP
jgi:hypothetical protein